MSTEKTPLLPSNANGSESSKYYFLKDKETHQGGTSESVVDDDGVPVIETLPAGATPDEFAPRVIGTPVGKTRKGAPQQDSSSTRTGFKLFTNLFKNMEEAQRKKRAQAATLIKKPRKVPVKVEPKVFFANERTFLAWMHLAVVLAGASIAIIAFTQNQNPFSQIYGVVLLPVAIAFIIYSMYQYSRRCYMIRNRMPGPYDDTFGPTLLGIMLMLSIVVQFCLKVYSMRYL